MSQENKYNPVDKFFQSQMKKAEKLDEGWTMPDDSILQGAFDVMDAEDERNSKDRKKLIFWIGGLGVLAIFGLIFSYSTNSPSITKQESQPTIAVEQSLIANKTEESSTTDIQPEEIIAEQIASEIKKESRAKNLNTPSTVIKSEEVVLLNSKELIAEGSTSLSESKISETRSTTNTKTPIAKSIDNQVASIKGNTSLLNLAKTKASSGFELNPAHILLLDKLSPRTISFETEAYSFVQPNTDINHSSQGLKDNWSMFVSGGHFLSNLSMTNGQLNSDVLSDYDRFYSGWQLNTGMLYQLSQNTNVGLELGLYKAINHSLYENAMIYNTANEYTNGDGEVVYSTKMNVRTPMGDFEEDMTMKVKSGEMQDGDVMDTKTNIDQRITFVSLNAVVNQQLFTRNNFKLILTAGIGLNRIVSNSSEMDMHMYSKGVEMDSYVFTNSNNQDLNAYFSSARLGLSLQKDLSEHMFIQFGASVTRSLNSIATPSLDPNSRTYLQGFSNNLLLGFRF